MKVLTFDIEIKNKILDKGEKPEPWYSYCKGWGDHDGMGISFLGCHTSWNDERFF